MSTTIRLLVAAALVALTYGGVYGIRQARTPKEVRLPNQDLRKLPVRLGRWTGEDVPRDPETFPDAGAASTVSRIYRNPLGEMVSVYVAVWMDYQIGIPHPPEMCYRGAGYRIAAEEDLQLKVTDSWRASGRLLTLQREGQQVCVLYWYQLQDGVFSGADGQRVAMWGIRRAEHWPPLIKVMIEAPAQDLDETKAHLESIATPLLLWTREL